VEKRTANAPDKSPALLKVFVNGIRTGDESFVETDTTYGRQNLYRYRTTNGVLKPSANIKTENKARIN
jgi:hypothetical protein